MFNDQVHRGNRFPSHPVELLVMQPFL